MNGLIPKPEVKTLKWKDKLFYISILSLIVTIAFYAGFVYYLNGAQELVKAKNIEIRKVGTEEQKKSAEYVLKYETKIHDFSNLLNKHKYATNFLKFLDTSLVNGVIITDMSFDILDNKAALVGIADSFQILGEQEDFFKNHDMLTKASLGRASMDKKGKVNFDFELNINPTMFNKR